MRELTVRIYNVLFGDAILVTVPDEDEAGRPVDRRMLIDCGNALAGSAGNDAVFEPVLRDIAATLDGAPLDLYVMTHEHMDHVQGLLFGSQRLGISIKARQVWITASSAPDYYERFSNARKKHFAAFSLLDDTRRYLMLREDALPTAIATLLAINNPRASADCVDFLRGLGPTPPLYVHREADIAGQHPFRRATLRVLAPEEDTAIYYGRLRPHTLGPLVDGAVAAPADAISPAPKGVDPRHYQDLIQFRSSGMFANLLQIDKAANNTSVVIELNWEGWRLLFAGDAEEKSWALMDRAGLLRPAHFLKVSHHGSSNGTPEEVFDKILPAKAPDRRPRRAAVSTAVGAYQGVPDSATLARLAERAQLYDTRDLPSGAFYDIKFPKAGV